MVHQELASELNETYAEPAPKTEGSSLREAEAFEENLAEAVYEGLSWVSSIVASTLDMYVQDALTVETGLRKAKLSIRDCENLEKGLEKAFGFGAKVVESKILKILHSKLGVSKAIEANFKFSNEVRIARELHSSRLHSQNIR
jgi:hypothetical protein